MLLRVVTQYQERHGVGKAIHWCIIASQVAKAGVVGRDNKSCNLRQELLNPTPAQTVHARLDVSLSSPSMLFYLLRMHS